MTFDHFCWLLVILGKGGELVLPGKRLTYHCNVDAVGWASEIICQSTHREVNRWTVSKSGMEEWLMMAVVVAVC